MEDKPKRKWLPLAGEKEKEANKPKNPEVENLRPIFFKDWFNEQTLSDLVIHTSKDPTARKYYCHKFIISCSCPILYEKLMETKFEDAADKERDHVLLVDPLKDKDEKMVTSFFKVLYDSSLMKDDAIKPLLDYLAEVYKKFGATDLASAIEGRDGRIGSAFAPYIEKFVPKLGHDTPLSDITLYFSKDKSISLKAHRIMLAKYSSYFKGLFASGMKDSNTHESIISLEGDHKAEDIAKVMESVMSLLYGSKKPTLFMYMDFTAEQIVGMNTLAHKYFFEEVRSGTENYINSYPSMNFVEPALKYDNQTALMSATKALIEVTLSIDLNTLPVDYLNVVRYTDNQNMFHAIVENQFQPGSEPRLRQINALQARLGSAAQIKITDLDSNNNSCLHYACRDVDNNKELIKFLIGQKLDVNACNTAKEQPLGIALQSWVNKSYISAAKRQEARNEARFYEMILGDDSDDEGDQKEPKHATTNGVDELILAGAKVDLGSDENLKNLLCFACSYGNHRSKDCWKKITEYLISVPKDRLIKTLEREYVNLFLQEKYKYPIKFFFEQIGVTYKTKATKLNSDSEVTLEVHNLTSIIINGSVYKLQGVSVKVEGTKYLTRRNTVVKNDISFTVKLSTTKKYEYKYSTEAVNLICGLVAVVNGKKNVVKQYKDPKY